MDVHAKLTGLVLDLEAALRAARARYDQLLIDSQARVAPLEKRAIALAKEVENLREQYAALEGLYNALLEKAARRRLRIRRLLHRCRLANDSHRRYAWFSTHRRHPRRRRRPLM